MAIVDKIDYETYKNLKKHFDCVYHSKNGESYPLDKDLELFRDILIVDDTKLYTLIDDLREQGFCDTVEFSYIDDYGYDPYLAF